MRILQINAVYRKLSTGRSASELSEACHKMGHRCVTAFSVGTVVDSDQEYLIGGPVGQKWHGFLSRVTGLQGYYSYFSTRKLLKFMDQYQPDLVVLRNLHANYIHLPKLLAYLAKKDIPTVAVLHDCWFYTGKCCHYTVSGCYRWQENCGNCPAKKKYNKSWFFDRSTKMLNDKKAGFSAIPRLYVVAVSQWLLEQAKKAPVFEKALQLKRIYNWIDMERFKPCSGDDLREKFGFTNEKIILSVAGAWDQNKGLDTVLAVANKLREPEHLVLVGNIPEGLSLPANVTHIPRTDSVEKLVELYNIADVFLQPSLEETFGKVSAEALACGTPVVCFDSTANPELIGENCGKVVAAKDSQMMMDSIREILQTGKQQYTKSCRSFAMERFNMEDNIGQYMELFSEMIAQ